MYDSASVVTRRVRFMLRNLYSALASAATNVTTLELCLLDPVDVDLFLECMPRLRSVAISSFGNGKTLTLLTQLPELETLILTVPSLLAEQIEKATMNHLSHATPERMPRLRALTVITTKCFGSLDRCVHVLLEATAASASGATALHLDTGELSGPDPDRVIGAFLERMPRLRVVKLSHCFIKTVALLSRLPELEELTVSVWLPDASAKVTEGLTVRDFLAGMRCLRSVHLGEVSSVGVLAALAGLPRLEVLSAKVLCTVREQGKDNGDDVDTAIEVIKAKRPDVHFIVKVDYQSPSS